MASAFRRKILGRESGHAMCRGLDMAHPYPRHRPELQYVGKQRYFLTFCTDERLHVFTDADRIALVLAQFLRAGAKFDIEVSAHCFMPDHVHLIVTGLDNGSDCLQFIKAAKQYSGYHFQRSFHQRLWQRYGHERLLRDDTEVAFAIGYLLANPVRAGLVKHPCEYPHLGSQRYSMAELLAWCEYSERWL